LSGDHSGPARQAAEQRFLKLEGLLERLGSSESANRRWRETCLDTRKHVQFVAEERDEAGRIDNYYKDSGGLSGGERQKLVIFCLAAALRYQLARDDSQEPRYGLVVLDEAFDKTDPAFTRLGLEVFRRFGFQLLLATPEKMLQTLEDYVGGAVTVHNDTTRGSTLEAWTWEVDDDAEASREAEELGAQDALFTGLDDAPSEQART